MNDRVRTVTLSSVEPTGGDAVGDALQATLDRAGPTLLFEPDKLRRHLEGLVPDAGDRIAQVLAALDAHVPQTLLGAHVADELRTASLALEQRLIATGGLDPDASAWAVATWAKALRIDAVEAPPHSPIRPPASPAALPATAATATGGGSAIEAVPVHADPPLPVATRTSQAFEAEPVDSPAAPPATRARRFARLLNLAYGIVGVVAAAVIGFYANRYLTTPEAGSAPTAELPGSLPAPAAPGASVAVTDPLRTPAPVRSSTGDGAVATGSSVAPLPALPPVASASTNPPLGSARPSTIEDIAGLSDVPVGRPFSVIIAYRAGDREPESIERTVLERRGVRVVATTPVSMLARGADGALVYPFDAIARPARTTMEFVLIDADGVRSEPRRVVLGVVTPAAAQVASSSCKRETCGSVVSVRPLGGAPPDAGIGERVAGAVAKAFGRETPPVARGAYEVTIRMDDRSVHTMTRLAPWKTGTRVRLVANRFVALGERAPSGRAMRSAGRLLPESAPFVSR